MPLSVVETLAVAEAGPRCGRNEAGELTKICVAYNSGIQGPAQCPTQKPMERTIYLLFSHINDYFTLQILYLLQYLLRLIEVIDSFSQDVQALSSLRSRAPPQLHPPDKRAHASVLVAM